MRYSNDHKAGTRQRVLKEAAREIRAKGPDGVAVAGVMARAGLTHGGFYAHFESKDAMIADAIGTMFEDARARAGTLDQGGDPRAALRAYVDFYLSPAHRDNRDRGCPLPTLSGDLARSGDGRHWRSKRLSCRGINSDSNLETDFEFRHHAHRRHDLHEESQLDRDRNLTFTR